MFSDNRNDVAVPIHIDLVEKLVRIAFAVVMFQHPNEMAALDQRDDLFEADPSLPDEPGVLVRVEGILPFFHVEYAMTMCAYCQYCARLQLMIALLVTDD